MARVHTTFDPSSKTGTWFSLLLIGVGSVCFSLSVWMGCGAAKLTREGETTVGRVASVATEVERDSNGNDRIAYRSTIRFRDRAGKSREIVHNGKLQKRQQVEVLYLPSAPQSAELNRFSAIWTAPLLFGGIGLALLGGGAWMVGRCQRASEDRDWLMQNGEKITAEICGVVQQRSYRNHGQRNVLYHLVARTVEPNAFAGIKFESPGIQGEPSGDVVGRSVEILVDPNDPQRYYMDVTQLA